VLRSGRAVKTVLRELVHAQNFSTMILQSARCFVPRDHAMGFSESFAWFVPHRHNALYACRVQAHQVSRLSLWTAIVA
jgi:hypothetical protein